MASSKHTANAKNQRSVFLNTDGQDSLIIVVNMQYNYCIAAEPVNMCMGYAK